MNIRVTPFVLAFVLMLSTVAAQAQSNLSDYAGDFAKPTPSEAPSAPSTATPTSPQAAFGGLTFFTDRPTFTAATGPLPTESFEGSNLQPGDLIGCDSPLNSATDDACYSPGAVIDGFTLNAFGGTNNRYATVTPGALDSPSTVVGPIVEGATAELLFPGSPTAVGFDLSDAFNGASFTIEVFGADGSLGSTVVAAPAASTGGTFAGVTSMTPITRITISDPVGTSQQEFQLIDNLAFGMAEPPEPTCPEALYLSDVDMTFDRVSFRSTADGVVNVGPCTFVATYTDAYNSVSIFGFDINSNSTVTISPAELRDTFGGVAIIDRETVPLGTSIAEIQPDIIASLVYLAGDIVYGFYHRDPAGFQTQCDAFPASQLHPFAQSQCSGAFRSDGTDGPVALTLADLMAAAQAELDQTASSETAPSVFALGAAYPNPLSQRGTITVEVPEAADVRVVVYDLLGRQVATLAEAAMEAGQHEVTLDASTLAPGTYVVRATADSAVATQRITVVR